MACIVGRHWIVVPSPYSQEQLPAAVHLFRQSARAGFVFSPLDKRIVLAYLIDFFKQDAVPAVPCDVRDIPLIPQYQTNSDYMLGMM
jgi:hypothetical protein